MGSRLMAIGGTSDHIHVLCECSKNHAAAKLIKEIKAGSSTWIKTKGKNYRDFHWQAGYGVFSVSPSFAGRVTAYIESQCTHHAELSFQDEFRALLRKHSMAFNEAYVWD